MFSALRSKCGTLLRGDSALWTRALSAAAVPSPLQQIPVTVSPEGEATPVIDSPKERVARAVYRQLPISSKKLTPVAKLVRKMKVEDALLQCDLLSKKAALMVQNAIRSARANGVHNYGLDGSKLFVEQCYATNGHNLKRIKPHGKGRYGQMLRRRTHLTVILREDESPRPSPHRIQATWLQRQKEKEEAVSETFNRQTSKTSPPVPFVKWKKQLRRMRWQNKLERKKAKETERRQRKRDRDASPESQDASSS